MATATTLGLGATATLDKRTQKAQNEGIHVTDASLEFDAFGNFSHIAVQIVNEDGSGDGPTAHTVMVSANGYRVTGCTCPDMAYHSPEGGCKHMRYVEALIAVSFRIMDADSDASMAERYAGLRELVSQVTDSSNPSVVAEMADISDRVVKSVEIVGDVDERELEALTTALKRSRDAN